MQNSSAVIESTCEHVVNTRFADHYFGIFSIESSERNAFETSEVPLQNQWGSGSLCYEKQYASTSATPVEALLKWSVTRDVLRSCSCVSVLMFTVVDQIVHLTLTEVAHDCVVTKQWFFTPDVTVNEVFLTLGSEIRPGNRCFLFTPSRREVNGLDHAHLGANLSRAALQTCCPNAIIVHTDCLARLARRVLARSIGSDAKHWLRQISEHECMDASVPYIGNEYLTSAVKADSALILRLLVTPSEKLM